MVDPSQEPILAPTTGARYCESCGKLIGLGDRLSGKTKHYACALADEQRALEAKRQAELERRRAAEEEIRKQAQLAAEREREQARPRVRLVAERELCRRAAGFASILGQQDAVRRLLEFTGLYLKQGSPPGHILITGADGTGKHTLARAFSAECGVNFSEVSTVGLNKTWDLMGILTNLGDGDVLAALNVGKVKKNLLEILIVALKELKVDLVVDKGMFAKTINVPLKHFTCIATARAETEVPRELLEAFHLRVPLAPYSQSELQAICERLARVEGVSFSPSTAALIARIPESTPHQIQILVRRLKSTGRNAIADEEAAQIFRVLGFATPTGAPLAGSARLGQLSGAEFERLISALLQSMGFRTEITKASGDGGIDIVAFLDRPIIGGRYLIQCKRLAPEVPVGTATVREFYGALSADRTAVKGILITTSSFTTQAEEFARQLPIELIAGEQLQQLLSEHEGAMNAVPDPEASLKPKDEKSSLFD